jgi:hypothetical protein
MTANATNYAAAPAPDDKSLDCRARSAAWRGAAAWVVVSVWLATTGYAFWSFELGQQRSFESPRTDSLSVYWTAYCSGTHCTHNRSTEAVASAVRSET